MRGIVRSIGWLGLSVSFLAAACTGTTAEEPSTPTSGATAESSPTQEPAGGAIEGHVIGIGAGAPSYTVEAPAGWYTEDGSFVVKDGEGMTVGMSVWDVGLVPSDPCHWEGTMTDSGTTVDDLVALLLAQSGRHPTTPETVTLDGYQGVSLEWTVPADMVVTGDGDFKGCDESGNGHQDFFSWWGADTGGRYHQAAGQVDLLWVLDVDGQTLVVDATYTPDVPDADRAELIDVVESLHFVEPEA